MSAILGIYEFDLWNGPAPPAVKSTVDVIYRPGQSTASAKVLPNQSTPGWFEGIAFVPALDSHLLADSYRGIIGTIQPLLYGGVNWGHVLVTDVAVEQIAAIISVSGRHPGGAEYSYSPAARIVSRWSLVRLSGT